MHDLESILSIFSQIPIEALWTAYFKIKKRYFRANQASFRNSKINKEIMRKTRLGNKFIDYKTDADRIAYNKQRNYCFYLIRKGKKAYFNNL